MVAETGWTGGAEVELVPAGGRTVDEVLFAPPVYSERQIARAQAQADKEAQQAQADMIDADAMAVWRAQMAGREPPTVAEFLTGRGELSDRQAASRPDMSRMRQLRELADQHGLGDLLPGRPAALLDPNMGTIELGGGGGGPARRSQSAEINATLERHTLLGQWFHGYAVRTGRPVGRQAVRSEQETVECAECVKAGATEAESFLIHSDPKPPVYADEDGRVERYGDRSTPMIYR